MQWLRWVMPPLQFAVDIKLRNSQKKSNASDQGNYKVQGQCYLKEPSVKVNRSVRVHYRIVKRAAMLPQVAESDRPSVYSTLSNTKGPKTLMYTSSMWKWSNEEDKQCHKSKGTAMVPSWYQGSFYREPITSWRQWSVLPLWHCYNMCITQKWQWCAFGLI